MKLKNVKIGARVVLKDSYDRHPNNEQLKSGMTGVILENDSVYPYVSWDNFYNGHSDCLKNVYEELPENSSWAVSIKYLKLVDK